MSFNYNDILIGKFADCFRYMFREKMSDVFKFLSLVIEADGKFYEGTHTPAVVISPVNENFIKHQFPNEQLVKSQIMLHLYMDIRAREKALMKESTGVINLSGRIKYEIEQFKFCSNSRLKTKLVGGENIIEVENNKYFKINDLIDLYNLKNLYHENFSIIDLMDEDKIKINANVINEYGTIRGETLILNINYSMFEEIYVENIDYGTAVFGEIFTPDMVADKVEISVIGEYNADFSID